MRDKRGKMKKNKTKNAFHFDVPATARTQAVQEVVGSK